MLFRSQALFCTENVSLSVIDALIDMSKYKYTYRTWSIKLVDLSSRDTARVLEESLADIAEEYGLVEDGSRLVDVEVIRGDLGFVLDREMRYRVPKRAGRTYSELGT